MPTKPHKNFFEKTVDAVKEAVRYDLMLLKVRSYLTESEQLAIAFILAVLVMGLVKKYLM